MKTAIFLAIILVCVFAHGTNCSQKIYEISKEPSSRITVDKYGIFVVKRGASMMKVEYIEFCYRDHREFLIMRFPDLKLVRFCDPEKAYCLTERYEPSL